MEETNFSILLFLFLFTSLCDSQDYNYDEYNYYYDEYNYDDYSGYQNLPAPAPLPISPPPFMCYGLVPSIWYKSTVHKM